MNEEHKRRGLAHCKILSTVALSALFLGSSPVYATQAAPTGAATALEQQQSINVTITVTSASGPVIGANVIQKGTTNGSITDINGIVTLNVPRGATLQVSFTATRSKKSKQTEQTLQLH